MALIQFNLKGQMTPQGVCCEQCWTAKEDKCVCRCGGQFHGVGNHKQDGEAK